MQRYLVESTHTAEDCLHVVEQFVFHGFIRNFDWGCKAGVHKSWAIVEAESEAEALLAIPPVQRARSRAIRLVKFSPEDIQQEHI